MLLAFANVNAVEKRIGIAAVSQMLKVSGTETLKDLR